MEAEEKEPGNELESDKQKLNIREYFRAKQGLLLIRGGGGGEGVLPEKLGKGVRPASQDPYCYV